MSRGRRQALATQKAMQVYRLFVRGWDTREIAQGQGIPLRTVQWLLQESGRITDGQIAQLTKSGVLRELFEHHRERKRTLWNLYTTAKMEAVRVACLKQLAEEDDRMLDLAERLGVIDQKTVKWEGDMNWVGLLTAALQHRDASGDYRRTGAGLAAPLPN